MLQDSDESHSDMDEYVHSMGICISGREGYMAGNLVLALPVADCGLAEGGLVNS